MIQTKCKFYYGYEITLTNNLLDFDEGSGELTATLRPGKYTLTDILVEIKRAFEEVGSNTYTVTAERDSRYIAIEPTSGTIEVLPVTGSNVGNDCWELLGFLIDFGPDTSASSDQASGFEWVPQFFPQAYVFHENNQRAIDGTVRKSQSGVSEAVIFGTDKIAEMNFKYINNSASIENVLDYDSSGVENARAFMEWCCKKGPVEFMPDRSLHDSYYTYELESTEQDQNGLNFKLKELYAEGLVDWYETGLLKFRLIS